MLSNLIHFRWHFCFRLSIFELRVALKLTLYFDCFFVEAGFVSAAMQAVESGGLATFAERFHSFTGMHFLDGLCFEQFALELVSGLRSLLQDLNGDPLVLEVFIFNLLPVDLGVLRMGRVNNPELRIVAYLLHLPLDVAFVVVGEGGLTKRIGFGHFKDLAEQVLVLFGQHQSVVLLDSLLLKNFFCVVRQINFVQGLLTHLHLSHADHLSQEERVFYELVVENVLHLHHHRLIRLQTLGPQRIF